jgi:hypothetical protein
MPHVIADRVRERFTGGGQGDLTLAGAFPGFVTFEARIGVGNDTNVCAVDPATGQWEVFTARLVQPGLLQRGAFRSSSTGSRVNFSVTGTKDVFATLPAAETMLRSDILAAIAAVGGGGGGGGGGGPMPVEIVTATTYALTVANSPARAWRRFTGEGCVVSIPTHADQPIPIGTKTYFEYAMPPNLDGQNLLQVEADLDVTLTYIALFRPWLSVTAGVMTVVKVLDNEWHLRGDLDLNME